MKLFLAIFIALFTLILSSSKVLAEDAVDVCLENPSDPACSGRPAEGNPAPQNMPLTCDAVNTVTTCGQTTYDNCGQVKYESDGRAYYDCQASQNSQCQGKIYCSTLDQGGSQGGQNNTQTNAQINTQQQVNNQRQNIVLAIPPQQVVTRTEVIRETQPIAQTASPRVITAGAVGTVQELPKTGLPLLAYAAAAFVPLGAKLKGFKKGPEDLIAHPKYLWEKRQFNTVCTLKYPTLTPLKTD